MLKSFLVCLILASLNSCTNTPPMEKKHTGLWVRVLNESHNKGVNEKTSDEELNSKFAVADHTCTFESSKVIIPSLSCPKRVQQYCSRQIGLNTKFCKSMGTTPKCDYRMVNSARKEKYKIYKNCMNQAGWEKKWQKEMTDGRYVKLTPNLKMSDEAASIQDVINSIPELAKWQNSESQEMWSLAVSTGEQLKASDGFSRLTLKEQLLLILKETKLKKALNEE